MTTTRTHYEMLGLELDADTAAIKAAWRKLARTMHPDVGGNSALFGLITEAKDCLSDPSKRAEYDRYLAAGGDRAAHAAAATETARAAAAATAAKHAEELRQARAQGRPAPETGDAFAAEAAQYETLLRQGHSNRERARRAEEERENFRQATLDAVNDARARARATRRARHPLGLWLPMIAAVLLGAALSHQLDVLGLGRTPVAFNPSWWEGVVGWFAAALRISYTALAGGYLIARRNTMSRLRVRDAAAICTAWGLVTALADRLPAIFELRGVGGPAAELLPVVVTAVALMLTGLRAAGRNTGGPLPTLWCATKEVLICVKDALLVVPRRVGAAL
jgi:hypothetical protein